MNAKRFGRYNPFGKTLNPILRLALSKKWAGKIGFAFRSKTAVSPDLQYALKILAQFISDLQHVPVYNKILLQITTPSGCA